MRVKRRIEIRLMDSVLAWTQWRKEIDSHTDYKESQLLEEMDNAAEEWRKEAYKFDSKLT